jgi:hypothetical protein
VHPFEIYILCASIIRASKMCKKKLEHASDNEEMLRKLITPKEDKKVHKNPTLSAYNFYNRLWKKKKNHKKTFSTISARYAATTTTSFLVATFRIHHSFAIFVRRQSSWPARRRSPILSFTSMTPIVDNVVCRLVVVIIIGWPGLRRRR